MKKHITRKVLFAAPVFFLVIAIAGCGSYMTPLRTQRATVGAQTQITHELTLLPEPSDKIVAAVYKFRDQTGQYKAMEAGSSFSTAVTQGATSILLKALEESGWFTPIEREGLSNLLNERKIIRSSRANLAPDEGDVPQLPPLLFAGVILEGGIISYDTNILTGGAGLQYFGAGASGKYRQDRVTVYLRAIATKSGRVLKTVYTSKTILSQMVDVGVFRFVKFQRLLEAETGYSFNEPPEMCVREAIEKAVLALVVEGAIDGLWQFKDPGAMDSYVVRQYLLEKEQSRSMDALDLNLANRRPLSASITVGGTQYSGDYSDPSWTLAAQAMGSMQLNEQFSIGIAASYDELSAQDRYSSTILQGKALLQYQMMPNYQINPTLYGGGGIVYALDQSLPAGESESSMFPVLTGGASLEYLINRSLGVMFMFDYNYLLDDAIDGRDRGKINDYFISMRTGISLYF